MLEEYLCASIGQLIERCRLLVAKIPVDLPRDYDTLAQTCQTHLKSVLQQLRTLRDDRIFRNAALDSERLRLFKRAVADMDLIETMGIAALDRAKSEDHALNALLERITGEIRYPLVTPVVTTLSQQYFCIFPELNLLCVPLTEGEFLLHLPDLYHELAHPLLSENDHPRIEPFQHALGAALADVMRYLGDERTKAERRNGPVTKLFYLDRWEVAWAKFWMVEFFCDLFGVYTLGPAFAWAHLHLCAKRGSDPYATLPFASSHPADDARMRVMLKGLQLIGYDSEATLIKGRWDDLLERSGAKDEPEYLSCYPEPVLASIAKHSLQGMRDMQCRIAGPQVRGIVHDVLNLAWAKFWEDPSRFAEWERSAVKTLKQQMATCGPVPV